MDENDIDVQALRHWQALFRHEIENDEITPGSLWRLWITGRQVDRLMKRIVRRGL